MQARTDLEATKKRIADSERRIDEKLPQFVDKKYWWDFLDDLPLHADHSQYHLPVFGMAKPAPASG